MEELEKTAKKQLLVTKITCTVAVLIGVAVLLFFVMTVPKMMSVMEKTDDVLEKTDAILTEVDVDSVRELNDTIDALNQAVAPLKSLGSLFGGENQENQESVEK